MSLDNVRQIDAMGVDKDSGRAVLTIVDSWDWSDERRHLLALQAKLNSYFEFIESGQVSESYPDAIGRDLVIDIVARFPPPPSGVSLIDKAAAAAAELGTTVRAKVVSP